MIHHQRNDKFEKESLPLAEFSASFSNPELYKEYFKFKKKTQDTKSIEIDYTRVKNVDGSSGITIDDKETRNSSFISDREMTENLHKIENMIESQESEDITSEYRIGG